MSNDPVSGPLSREQLKELSTAPFGEATKVIRKYDPLFGRRDGEKFQWKVIGHSQCRMVAYVEASSQDEADKLADKLDESAFDYESEGRISIISVEPAK